MKNILRIKRTLLSISLISISCSSFGFGSVVTDPYSYTYFIEQIENGVQMLEKAEKSIDLATDTYDEITSLDDRLSGNFNRAKNAVNSIGKLKDIQSLDDFKDIRRSVQFTQNTMTDLLDTEEYTGDIEKNIDALFGDGKSSWVDLGSIKSKKQQGYKNAIISAELAKGKASLQLEKFEEYGALINSTNTSKDAQDVNNTLLLEMLENQRELIKLMSTVSKNIAIANYDGKENVESNPTNYKGKKMTDKNYWDMKKGNSKRMSECSDSNSCDTGLFDGAW